MKYRRALCTASLLLALAACAFNVQAAPAAAPAQKSAFVDPLDAPALMHGNVAGRPVMAVARAGARLIAVGMRGLVIVSDDAGKNWRQSAAPVRSDLLALSFPTERDGWAVGHDGVVLHTADAGNTWTRQFDGRMAAAALTASYKTRIANGDATLQPYLEQLALNYKQGPSLPLLSVWFDDAQHGMAVGPFGSAIATSDGGKTWLPMLERIDNPHFLHLNAIRGIAGHVFIAGEKGMVYRLDRTTGKFSATPTGYVGSFFGIEGGERALFAYGLRGTIYRSTDLGMNWVALKSPLHGGVTSAAPIEARHAMVFVTSSGEATLYDSATDSFSPLKLRHAAALTGVVPISADMLALTSLSGASLASAR
ncbi:WD40/YVTN/BNR-like repeat-containing protein [Paraburkholderia kirstenboschensis]|uniref:WD40/YVTN/BNR-like repeat-containing protein n=2 Tax=Paraburkholderia kirstenboschensis TaxID=1245436 RepID=UPI00191A3798|nr:YCF48-related protein [Paraburkholderia kirstenboschensis]